MREVRKAKPEAARLALVVIAATVLIGALVIGTLMEPLEEWVVGDPGLGSARYSSVALATGVVLSLPFVAFALYLWRLGEKVIAAQRFPLPGQRSTRTTRVLQGAAAVSRGGLLRMLAAFLMLTMLIVWWMLWQLTSLLE